MTMRIKNEQEDYKKGRRMLKKRRRRIEWKSKRYILRTGKVKSVCEGK